MMFQRQMEQIKQSQEAWEEKRKEALEKDKKEIDELRKDAERANREAMEARRAAGAYRTERDQEAVDRIEQSLQRLVETQQRVIEAHVNKKAEEVPLPGIVHDTKYDSLLKENEKISAELEELKNQRKRENDQDEIRRTIQVLKEGLRAEFYRQPAPFSGYPHDAK